MPNLDFDASFAALESGFGARRLDDVGLWISGADRASWLQGQITNDIRLLSSSSPLPFCLCSPSGQIEAIGRLYEVGDRYLLISSQSGVAAMVARIQSNVILEEVVGDPSGEPLYTVQGRGAVQGDGFLHDRTGRGGFDCFGDPGELPMIEERAFAVAQLEAGIPIEGVDTQPRSLPPELGPAFDQSHVSYQKGCFTGQEILHRIYSRGGPSKSWVGLHSDYEFTIGGAITRAERSPAYGFIGAATLRKDVAVPGTIVEVEGVRATVVEMPFLRS